MPQNTGLSLLPPPQLAKACSAQLLPRGPPSGFWASFQPLLQLTPSLLCGQHRTLGENLVLPWKPRRTLPSLELPGEIKILQGMVLQESLALSYEGPLLCPLLCPGRALHSSFPRRGGTLLKEDFMVGFLVHLPWQLPRGKGLPFVRRTMRVQWGQGCDDTISSSLIWTETFSAVAGLTPFNAETTPPDGCHYCTLLTAEVVACLDATARSPDLIAGA